MSDGHDYPQRGKHDPLDCRFCLRKHVKRLSPTPTEETAQEGRGEWTSPCAACVSEHGNADPACPSCGGKGYWTHERASTPLAPPRADTAGEGTQSWAVMVERNGENVVTLSSSTMSGKPDLDTEDEVVIRTAAQHLESFVGKHAIECPAYGNYQPPYADCTCRSSRPPAAEGERPDDEAVARLFHEAYERLAPSLGYETRRESAKPWAEVPAQNRALMVAVVGEVRRALDAAREGAQG